MCDYDFDGVGFVSVLVNAEPNCAKRADSERLTVLLYRKLLD